MGWLVAVIMLETPPFRNAIATPASTTGNDQAQSPRYVTAAAATTQPPKKPTRRCNELVSRSAFPAINGSVRDCLSSRDRTGLVKLPVMTAAEVATDRAKRRRAN